MKTAHKFLVACVTAVGLVSFASQAEAETAAGSAAFSINNAGVVTGVAMSAVVSDGDSLAVAMNTMMGNATFALGSDRRIDAPDWTRPADGAGQTASTQAIVGTADQNIFIYGGEPEYYGDSAPVEKPVF